LAIALSIMKQSLIQLLLLILMHADAVLLKVKSAIQFTTTNSVMRRNG